MRTCGAIKISLVTDDAILDCIDDAADCEVLVDTAELETGRELEDEDRSELELETDRELEAEDRSELELETDRELETEDRRELERLTR